MRCKRLVGWIAVSALYVSAVAATAAPVVLTQGISVVNVSGITQTYTVLFTQAFVGAGNYDLKLSTAGSFADGARDGATVAAVGASGQLADFSFVTGSGTKALGSAGTTATLAGSGGTGGVVQLTGFSLLDLGAPSSFSLTNTSGALSAGRGTAQSAVAGVGADGGTDGVEIGPSAGHALTSFGFVRSGGGHDLFDVDDSDATAGPYASVQASGSQFFDCATAPACTAQETDLNLQMAGGNDIAAFVMRHEFGGDAIADMSTVIDLIDPQTLLTSFSCAAEGGCLQLQMLLSFSITAGDAMSFVVRAEIDEGSSSVPEPAGLAVLLLASTAAGLARRRQRRG